MRIRLKATSILLAALLMLAGNAWASEDDTTQISLRETDQGSWVLSFRFPEPQQAVVMRQAPEPYRGGTWTSRTPGVALETIGEVDTITFETPGTEAVFEIDPNTRSVRKAYTPFLSFTDGGWGVLVGQFRVSSAAGRDEVAAFDGNGETWPGPLLDYRFTLSSPQAIYYDAEPVDGSLELVPEVDGKYAYVGSAEVQSGESFVGFIDQGLPAWIRDSLDDDLGLLFGQLQDEWGVSLPKRAEVLFVFDGADHIGLSQTGGAIGRQLALQVSGDALLEPDRSVIDFFRWFLAHEAAHLFQAAAGMGDLPNEHAWMHEGVANTMSHRIGARISDDGAAFLSEVYGTAFADCAGYLEKGAPLVEALQTGDFGVYYACGDLIALVTEAGLDEGDIFDFWASFLAEAAENHEGAITAARYFEHAERSGLDAETRQALEAFINEPVPEPRATLTTLLTNAGLSPEFDEEGRLTALSLPN